MIIFFTINDYFEFEVAEKTIGVAVFRCCKLSFDLATKKEESYIDKTISIWPFNCRKITDVQSNGDLFPARASSSVFGLRFRFRTYEGVFMAIISDTYQLLILFDTSVKVDWLTSLIWQNNASNTLSVKENRYQVTKWLIYFLFLLPTFFEFFQKYFFLLSV